MTHQTVVIVFCVMCLGVTMIVVGRLRPGHKFPKALSGPGGLSGGTPLELVDGRPSAMEGRPARDFRKNPLEILIDSLLSSAVIYLLIGLSPAAGASAVLLSGTGEVTRQRRVGAPTAATSGPTCCG